MTDLLNTISHYVPAWVWITLVVHGVVLGSVAYLILLERKVASWVQDRIGPNRVGPFGLLQPIADGLKFILKEDYRPKGVDKVLFTVAPAAMVLVVIISIAVIPWGGIKQGTNTFVYEPSAYASVEEAAKDHIPAGSYIHNEIVPTSAAGEYAVTYRWDFQIAKLDIGVLFVLAILSLAVYGVVLGGWASNNKYSFLGALRATANMVSYEIPLSLSVLTIIVIFGTLDLGFIVEKQAHYWAGFIPAWNVFCQPLPFLLFLICIHAEANRAPFDMAEAEQELVGGYHTEYSSMRFALFFLGEYAGMVTTSAVLVALFFGGWHVPGWTWLNGGGVDPSNPAVTDSILACIARGGVFFIKTIAVLFVFMWVRWSLPRFRFDQLMSLAWRGLIPLSLALMLGTAVVIYFYGAGAGRENLRVDGRLATALLTMNVIVLAGFIIATKLLPAGPHTNRKIAVPDSRYTSTPVPASAPAAGNA